MRFRHITQEFALEVADIEGKTIFFLVGKDGEYTDWWKASKKHSAEAAAVALECCIGGDKALWAAVHRMAEYLGLVVPPACDEAVAKGRVLDDADLDAIQKSRPPRSDDLQQRRAAAFLWDVVLYTKSPPQSAGRVESAARIVNAFGWAMGGDAGRDAGLDLADRLLFDAAAAAA